MDCEKSFEMMSLYLDKELNKQEQGEFLKHLEECDDCKKEFEMFENIFTELNKTEFLPLPENYHEELMEKINNSKIKPVDFSSNKKNWKKYASIAASIMALVAVGIGGNALLKTNSLNKSATREAKSEMYSMPAEAPSATANDSVAYGGAGKMKVMTEEEGTASAERGVNESNIIADTAQRKKIKNSYVSLTVTNFDDTVGLIKENIESNGGYVENFNSYIFYEDINNNVSLKAGNVSVKVSVESYDNILGYIRDLGTVTSENEYVEDITSQYVDTEARLNTKRAEEKRLLELLEKAESVEDIISIESRLGDIRGYIESYEMQLKNWDKLVSFSTINIELREKEPKGLTNISPNFGEKLRDSFVKSFNYVVNGIQNLILGVAAASLPVILSVSVVFIGYKIIRNLLKKRKMK